MSCSNWSHRSQITSAASVASDEHGQQRRLADPGRAFDDHHLSVLRTCRHQPATKNGKLPVTAHQH